MVWKVRIGRRRWSIRSWLQALIQQSSAPFKLKLKLKLNKALDENSSLSYVASPAIWDHTVLPATRHKWTHRTLTPTSKLVLDLLSQERWKAELARLGYQAMHRPGVELATCRSQVRRSNHYSTEPLPFYSELITASQVLWSREFVCLFVAMVGSFDVAVVVKNKVRFSWNLARMFGIF